MNQDFYWLEDSAEEEPENIEDMKQLAHKNNVQKNNGKIWCNG